MEWMMFLTVLSAGQPGVPADVLAAPVMLEIASRESCEALGKSHHNTLSSTPQNKGRAIYTCARNVKNGAEPPVAMMMTVSSRLRWSTRGADVDVNTHETAHAMFGSLGSCMDGASAHRSALMKATQHAKARHSYRVQFSCTELVAAKK